MDYVKGSRLSLDTVKTFLYYFLSKIEDVDSEGWKLVRYVISNAGEKVSPINIA